MTYYENYLPANFPKNMSYDRLRDAVKKAWNNIGYHEFRELRGTMPERCKLAINAKDLFTNIRTSSAVPKALFLLFFAKTCIRHTNCGILQCFE